MNGGPDGCRDSENDRGREVEKKEGREEGMGGPDGVDWIFSFREFEHKT